MTANPLIQHRKEELIREAQVTIEAIRLLAGSEVDDPCTDPGTLARAVTSGVLDAPHLRNNPAARGQITTRIDLHGACVAVDPVTGQPLSEQVRIAGLGIWPPGRRTTEQYSYQGSNARFTEPTSANGIAAGGHESPPGSAG